MCYNSQIDHQRELSIYVPFFKLIFVIESKEDTMGVWVIDVYTNENDKAPTHRALAVGNIEEDALAEASKAYPSDKLVVSVGRTHAKAVTSGKIRKLW